MFMGGKTFYLSVYMRTHTCVHICLGDLGTHCMLQLSDPALNSPNAQKVAITEEVRKSHLVGVGSQT
jgi:hypothetical protein